jgi:hypothetical protein
MAARPLKLSVMRVRLRPVVDVVRCFHDRLAVFHEGHPSEKGISGRA